MKNYDYIIIGTGPAGSIIASNLAKEGKKIAMIDRATNTNLKNNKNSFKFSPYVNNCPNHYSPLFSNQLGGNSALWNNKVFLLTEEEFNTANWGFQYNELLEYSKDLSKQLNIDHKYVSNVSTDNNVKYSSSFRAKKLGNIFHYLKILENKNIDVYYPSTPIKLIFDEKKKVKALMVKNYESKNDFTISLNKALIFCAGGLGNPNLIQNLIKNSNPLIGKNLSDHPHINLGSLKLDQAKEFFKLGKYFLNQKDDNTELNSFFKIKSHFVGIQLDFIADPSRFLKRIFIRSRYLFPKIIISFLIKYYALFIKICIKIFSVINLKGKYSYEFFFSQEPNIKNSIEIDHNIKDEYGLFKSNINWDFSESEKEEYQVIINHIIGKDGVFPNNNNVQKFDTTKILAGLHPSCTTSIGDNGNSCVDKNLNLIGYDNIFLSGSSVFKINGFTNPTWTIMTLSNRLSSYLKKKK
jgi:hypothetical protein